MKIKDHQIESAWRGNIEERLTYLNNILASMDIVQPSEEDLRAITDYVLSKNGLSATMTDGIMGDIDVS
jgi:hypothetical protein